MFASQYLEGLVAGWLRGDNFPADPASLELALSTANPTDTGGGLAEPANLGYARQAVTLSAPVTNDVSGAVTSNSNAIEFTAEGDITHFALLDDADNVLFYGPLASVRHIVEEDTITFAATTLSFALKGLYGKYLAEAVINWMRSTAMPAAPAELRFALSTANPTRDGSGILEPAGIGGYGRQLIAFDTPDPVTGTGTSIANDADIIFGPATATWGSITHWAIYADATENMVLYGALSAAKQIGSGSGFGINEGAASLLIR